MERNFKCLSFISVLSLMYISVSSSIFGSFCCFLKCICFSFPLDYLTSFPAMFSSVIFNNNWFGYSIALILITCFISWWSVLPLLSSVINFYQVPKGTWLYICLLVRSIPLFLVHITWQTGTVHPPLTNWLLNYSCFPQGTSLRKGESR